MKNSGRYRKKYDTMFRRFEQVRRDSPIDHAARDHTSRQMSSPLMRLGRGQFSATPEHRGVSASGAPDRGADRPQPRTHDPEGAGGPATARRGASCEAAPSARHPRARPFSRIRTALLGRRFASRTGMSCPYAGRPRRVAWRQTSARSTEVLRHVTHGGRWVLMGRFRFSSSDMSQP